MIDEKLNQAVHILNERGIDMWLTFVRETSSTPDPVLDLILGAHVVWPSAFILTGGGEKIAVVGSLDMQNVRDHADYEVVGYVDSIKPALLKLLKRLDPQKIVINFSTNDVTADGMTHGMYLLLMSYLKGTPYADRIESSEAVISALRGRKSGTEIEHIRGAIRETLKLFDAVTEHVRPGMSEFDVADFIRQKMEEKNLEPAWDADQCPAVFTGPDSAGAHATPTGRLIEPGHIMNIDFGVRWNGYVSDLQRTWYFLRQGEIVPPEAVENGFRVIRDAIRKAAGFLKPGVEGWAVDEVARTHITDAGYAEYPHALGHQVGRKAHDGSTLLCPKWERYGDLPHSKVEAGQVFTLEPRLTVPGHGVATIEEIVVVTETGCEFLSEPQEEIIMIGPGT
ncbi:aminopeptidase P family protein [bacterium]|nr:aminopeptidase P family protein [bacterium]